MNKEELSAFADKVAMKLQTGNIADLSSYLSGVKIAAATLGYEKEWVDVEMIPTVKARIEGMTAC